MALGNNSNTGMAFLAGLLAGTFFGALAAALAAPSSGRELRSSLAKEGKKLAVKAAESVPRAWNHMVAEENTRDIIDHLVDIRSAGF